MRMMLVVEALVEYTLRLCVANFVLALMCDTTDSNFKRLSILTDAILGCSLL